MGTVSCTSLIKPRGTFFWKVPRCLIVIKVIIIIIIIIKAITVVIIVVIIPRMWIVLP